MKRLILLRHGETLENQEKITSGRLETRLNQAGIEQAKQAGLLLKKKNILPQLAFSSYSKRAIHTNNLLLDQMDLDRIPIVKSRRLNEKHYGILEGKKTEEYLQILGEEFLAQYKNDINLAPPPIEEKDPLYQEFKERYHFLKDKLPLNESLQNCADRVGKYYLEEIFPCFENHNTILVTSHHRSTWGIIARIKKEALADIMTYKIPNAKPYIFEFDEDMQYINDYYLE